VSKSAYNPTGYQSAPCAHCRCRSSARSPSRRYPGATAGSRSLTDRFTPTCRVCRPSQRRAWRSPSSDRRLKPHRPSWGRLRCSDLLLESAHRLPADGTRRAHPSAQHSARGGSLICLKAADQVSDNGPAEAMLWEEARRQLVRQELGPRYPAHPSSRHALGCFHRGRIVWIPRASESCSRR